MDRTFVYSFIFFLFIASDYASGSDASAPPYFQPVKIQTPPGSKVAFAANGQFVPHNDAPYAVGLLVGSDYRAKITQIPFHPGKEVFPSVKVIARTYPPEGRAPEYPILIDITQEDLELALDGKFVIRVVYLESPETALPIRSDLTTQLTTDIKTGDPIKFAATMGQPVAVLYLGGRVPNTIQAADEAFFHYSPPWAAITKTPAGRYESTFFGTTVVPRLVQVPVEPKRNRSGWR